MIEHVPSQSLEEASQILQRVADSRLSNQKDGHLYVVIISGKITTTDDREAAAPMREVAELIQKMSRENREHLPIQLDETTSRIHSLRTIIKSIAVLNEAYKNEHSAFLEIVQTLFSPKEKDEVAQTQQEIEKAQIDLHKTLTILHQQEKELSQGLSPNLEMLPDN